MVKTANKNYTVKTAKVMTNYTVKTANKKIINTNICL